MKVSLVVASGAHQGKAIPIVGTQFVIGRDPDCNLRPASQAVSKRHCAVVVRDGGVFLQDYGSTNGSLVNDAVVQGQERPLRNNDSLKIGPLDFILRVEADAPAADGTPLPQHNPAAAAAIAAVKAVARPATPGRAATPSPAAKPAGRDSGVAKAGSRETPRPAAPTEAEDNDRLAAMLLGMDDDEVPGGSTVADMPLAAMTGEAGADAGKPAEAKAPPKENTSNAASDLLRRYMRRPK